MRSKSVLIYTALLAGLIGPLSACGKKEKKTEPKPEQNVNPTPAPSPAPVDTINWPQVTIVDADKLSEKVKNGRVTINFQVSSTEIEQFEILCRAGKQGTIQNAQLQSCMNSYQVSDIKSGESYAFEVYAGDRMSGKKQLVASAFIGGLAAGEEMIQVEGEEKLKAQFTGTVPLIFSMSSGKDVTYKCAIASQGSRSNAQYPNCESGNLQLNLNQFQGQYVLLIAAYDANTKEQLAEKTVNFCGGMSCRTAGNGNGGTPGTGAPGYPGTGGGVYQPGYPGNLPGAPGGIPATGTIFNIPILSGVTSVSLGRMWNIVLPPRYHVLSYTNNHTLIGANTVEYTAIIDDPLAPSPFCDPFTSGQAGVGNANLITINDGDGIPRTYCRRFMSPDQLDTIGGGQFANNSVEFSSPAADLATYERFVFATYERGEDNINSQVATARFNALCSAAFVRKMNIPMNILNNWWNDPLSQITVQVNFCQTTVGGVFGAPLEVWVAGFSRTLTPNGTNDPNSVAQTNNIEMVYVASAAGLPTAFNSTVFLQQAAFRVRTMLGQTGLNAPFNVQ